MDANTSRRRAACLEPFAGFAAELLHGFLQEHGFWFAYNFGGDAAACFDGCRECATAGDKPALYGQEWVAVDGHKGRSCAHRIHGTG